MQLLVLEIISMVTNFVHKMVTFMGFFYIKQKQNVDFSCHHE